MTTIGQTTSECGFNNKKVNQKGGGAGGGMNLTLKSQGYIFIEKKTLMLGISKLGKSMKYRELAQVPSVTR